MPSPSNDAPLAACIGLDWASEHHDIAVQVAGTTPIETARVPHTPEALTAWLAALATRFPGQRVGIALETSRGPVVSALLEAPGVVLYPVNPRSLARFREVFAPSGAKDDLPDARLLLALLVQHRETLRPLRQDDVATRTLQRLVEQRRTLVEHRTQLGHQVHAALREYFPQALECIGLDTTTAMACAFLARWPTLEALQRARRTTVQRFYTTHNCRSRARLLERLTVIDQAQPLTTDAAIIESTALYVQALVQQLEALRPAIARFDTTIATHFSAHADAAIFASFPGAGPVFAPRLLAAFGTDRSRFLAATDMQQHAGIAPITVRSGKQCVVRWRWAASNFLRQTFHEFAQYSLASSGWAKAYYHRMRQRGHTRHETLRALAFKWIRILHRCWIDKIPYDEARYVRALTKRHSPNVPAPLTTHPAK